MALSDDKKAKLRDLLAKLSSPEEMAGMVQKDESNKKVDDIISTIRMIADNQDADRATIEGISVAADKQRKTITSLASAISVGFEALSKAITSKLDEVKGAYQGKKGQEDYALTLQNMAKSIADGLGAVKDSVDKKPVPVWRWPQYLYSGIRDTSFEPIDPAIDSFHIGQYDDLVLGYSGSNITSVTYYKGGAITAVLTLTYS